MYEKTIISVIERNINKLLSIEIYEMSLKSQKIKEEKASLFLKMY